MPFDFKKIFFAKKSRFLEENCFLAIFYALKFKQFFTK